MDTINKALYIFRNLVYCLYREIRVLKKYNHEVLYEKVSQSSNFFNKDEGRCQAEQLYKQTEKFGEIDEILHPYEKRTGLTLHDLCRAFNEGNWKNSHGVICYGGPRWGEIADAALELQVLISNQKNEEINALLHHIFELRHNTGKVIDKFHNKDILKRIG